MNFDKSNANGRFTLRLELTENAYSLVDNTSPVVWALKLIANTSYRFSDYTIGYSVTLNGDVVASQAKGVKSYSIASNGTLTLASGTYTAKHNADGSLDMPVAWAIEMASEDYTPGNLSGTGTMELDAIPRASTAGATDAYIEATTTITVNRKSDGYTHSIAYKFGSLSGYIDANGTTSTTEKKITATSIAFTLPSAWYKQIPDAAYGDCTITAKTYSGTTQIGTAQTSTFRARANPETCSPTVSVTAQDTNSAAVALTGSNKKILRGVSTLQVKTTATAQNSATIKQIDVFCGTQTNYNASTTFTFSEPVDSAEVRVVVTDSRGLQTTAYASGLTLIEYFAPVLYAAYSRVDPTSGDVNVTVSGKWFNGSLGKVANTLAVEVRFKPSTQSDWSDTDNPYYTVTLTKKDNEFSGKLVISGLSYDKAWTVRTRATDKICAYGGIQDAIYYQSTVPKAIPIAHWGEDDYWMEVLLHARGGLEAYAGAYSYSSSSDDTETAFQSWLNTQLNKMDDGSYREVAWDCYPAITGNRVYSRLYRHNADNAHLVGCSYNGNMYLKRKTAGSWQSTTTMEVNAPGSKPYLEAGDSITISGGAFAGYITTSAKDLFFTIPLAKACIASSVSITGSVIGRGVGGYIVGTSYDTSSISMSGGSGYTVKTAITPAGINVYFNFTAAITGATNNTPVTVCPDSQLKITFS